MIRRNDDFCAFRFFEEILFQVFDFIETIEQGKMTINFRNRSLRFALEKFLAHDTDLIGKQFNLVVII